MKATIQSIKGTRDFYPEDMAVRTWIYNTIRKVSESFGYQEYEGPFLESIELYAAKSGEELVKEQAFVFPDRGGDLITLRPELTLTLARMVAKRQRQLVYPLRWWSWGPFWRYERPQKGRTREFFQWNIDLIGVDTRQADAEIVAIAATFFRETGLLPDQVSILVNNRQLMNDELQALDIAPGKRKDVFHLIDRRDKMSSDQWKENAGEIGINQQQLDGLIALLTDEQLWKKSAEMEKFFQAVKALGVADYVHFAPYVIRGLDYYTGIVFEAWDRDGDFRAILGGGRYDNLVADVGGDPLPATGFAMGDMVVGLVLKKFGHIPRTGFSPAPVLVTVFDEDTIIDSCQLATELRQAGLKVDCYPEPAKIARQIKYGDKMGMRVAVILGADERTCNLVAIKDLQTGEQITTQREKAANAIFKILEGSPSS